MGFQLSAAQTMDDDAVWPWRCSTHTSAHPFGDSVQLWVEGLSYKGEVRRKYMTCVDVCMFPNIVLNVKFNQTEILSNVFLWNPSCLLRPRMLFRVSLGKKILWDLDLISCSAWNRAKPLHWWHLSTSVARCLGIDLVVLFKDAWWYSQSYNSVTLSWRDDFETFKICSRL